ncbi:MAG: gliding motility-associated protein GldE [Alistipes sp.]|nr:gliding motility-associated protein GldE [Alistipes sp.]
MNFIEYLSCPPEVVLLIVVTVLLLMLSGMMSASEVAFFSLLPSDLRAIKQKGTVSSESVLRLLKNSDSLLASILVVNNLVNIAIVICSSKIVDTLFRFHNGTIEFLFTGVLVTFLLLLFGEILPKIVAQSSNVKVALLFAQPLVVLRWIFYPFSYILMRTSGRVGKMAAPNSDNISIEELADAVDMTTEPESEEQKILSGIVGIASREVEDIMRSRIDIKAVEQTMTFTEVKRVIIETGYSRLPVYNEDIDDIKGVLFVKDLLAHISKGDEFGWQKLIREPYFVPMHKKVNAVLEDFQRQKFHMAIVVDEYGATQGLISLEDILEEVVGEISDESDVEESFYRRLNENTYLFDGKTHIVDVTRVLDLDDDIFEDVQGRAETVAGLLLEINRNFLKKGDEVSAHGIRFIVEAMDGHRIDKIKIIVSNNNV